MATRLAAAMGLLAFAICLVVGGLQAGNPFATTVLRAMAAMVCTFVIGLIVGTMGQKMIDENIATEEKNLPNLPANSPESGR